MMINVLNWKKGLQRQRIETWSGLIFGMGIVVCKEEGQPVFYDPLPKTYEEYRKKYYKRKLPR